MTCDAISCCDFAGSYDVSGLPEIKKLEQAALGCDYGGTSWTTFEQVTDIVESLRLGADTNLLDIGAGAGWPGLLLGKLSQCAVTLLDIPLNALSQAVARATDDGMEQSVNVVSGNGTSLPFDGASFDRISHSDVLCCLPEKEEMLREARRVATDDARMHFSVILPADGLDADAYARVVETGPPFIALDGSYSDLLDETGWLISDCQDVTSDYKESLQRLVDGIWKHEDELSELLGAEDLIARRVHREAQIELVERGDMRRETYVARATHR